MPSTALHWCFTLNNYTEDERDHLLSLDVHYIIVGREVGEEGTPHLQGYVHLKRPLRLQPCKDFLGSQRIHLEVARGKPWEADEYCQKEGDYETRGTPPPKKKRNRDELATQFNTLITQRGNDGLLEFRAENPGCWAFSGHSLLRNYQSSIVPRPRRNVNAFWIWGDTGTGKSHAAWAAYPKAFSKEPKHKWWTGYLGEEEVIIDDFGKDNVDITLLLRWFDKYPTSIETKGGQMGLLATTFVVTSNFPPQDIYAGEHQLPALLRRLQVVEKRSIDDNVFRLYDDQVVPEVINLD